MNKISRRALALYAVDQLLAGKNAAALAKHIAAVLMESGRAGDGDFLLNDVAWELEQRQALTIGQITSAEPLSRQLAVALKAQLKKTTKSQEIMLRQVVDKSVIGGLKVETSGRVWDQTVARKLTDLRESF